MFDGRHCTKEDLSLLEKETNKLKSFLIERKIIDEQSIKQIYLFINLVNRFDRDIGDKLSSQIKNSDLDYKKVISLIDKNIDTLKQNIIVDIFEHQ